MRESVLLARSYQTRLHTHLAENDHDVDYSREKFNCIPAQCAQDLGWLGADVWHAHCVKLDDEGMSLFAASQTGVAYCPCSNMRLASGIAPVRKMLNAGAVHDPVDALLSCASPQAAYTVVHGKVVVRQGHLTTLELEPLLERHNQLVLQLAEMAT